MQEVLEFAKSIGGVGAILAFVLYGVYLAFKPLVDDHRELVRGLVKDQKESRDTFVREMTMAREECNAHQLEQQQQMSELTQSIRELRTSLNREEPSDESHASKVFAARGSQNGSGLRARSTQP